MYVQRFPLGGFKPEPDSFLLALGNADAAAHAFYKVHAGLAVDHADSVKLAEA